MEKTVRIALIGFLIVMAYATSIYIDTGSWIVPLFVRLLNIFWWSVPNIYMLIDPVDKVFVKSNNKIMTRGV